MSWKKFMALVMCSAMLLGIMDNSKEVALWASDTVGKSMGQAVATSSAIVIEEKDNTEEREDDFENKKTLKEQETEGSFIESQNLANAREDSSGELKATYNNKKDSNDYSAITFSPTSYIPMGEPKVSNDEETTIALQATQTENKESTIVSTSESNVETETSSSIDIEEPDNSGLISDNNNNFIIKASPGQGDFEYGKLDFAYRDKVNSNEKYSNSTEIQITWNGWYPVTNSNGKWSGIYFTNRKPSVGAYDDEHDMQDFLLERKYDVYKLPVDGDIPHNSGGKTSKFFKISEIPSDAKYLVLRGSNNDVSCYITYDGPTVKDIDDKAPTVTYSAPAGIKNPSTNVEWYADSVKVKITATDDKVNVTQISERASYESEEFNAHSTKSNPATFTKTLKPTSIATSIAYIRAYATDAVGNKSKANGTAPYNIDIAAPTITNIAGDKGMLTATISDAQSGLGGYAITNSPTAPESGWTVCNGGASQSISFLAASGGKYYIHVKDITNHITSSGEITVSPLVHTQTIKYFKQLPNNTWSEIKTETFTAQQSSTVEIAYKNCPPGYKNHSISKASGNDELTNNKAKITGANTYNVYFVPIKPTASHNIVGTKIGNWYKETTKATITGKPASGIAINKVTATLNGVSSTANGETLPLTFGEGKNVFTYNAVDTNGFTSAVGGATIYVDASSPTDVEITGVNEWNNSGITVTLKAKDAYSGIVKFDILKANGGAWDIYKTVTLDTASNDANETALITENGKYILAAYDYVGLETRTDEKNPFIVDKIDTTNPEIKSTIVAEQTADGKDFTFGDIEDANIKWYKETTEIQLDATDMKSADGNTSGLEKITYETTDVAANGEISPDKFTYNLTTSNALTSGLNTITATATDKASNVSDSVSETIYIDGEGPENYVVTKETEDWVSVDYGLKVSFSAEDMRSGIQLLEVLYSKDKTSWDEVVTDIDYEKLSSKTVSSDVVVFKNGYYKLRGTDALGHVTEQSDDAALSVKNIETGDEPQLTIKPDTTEWVNASTGVELTAGANNEGCSGITRVDVYGINENRYYKIISSGDTLKTAISEAKHKYTTFENGVFKTGAVTGTGKNVQMDDSEAYEVTNIDGIAPEIATSSDNKWVREEDGYNITAVVTDPQSGIGSVKLQKFNEETYSYEDVNVTATEAKYVNGEENMMEAPEKGTILNTVNAVKKAFLEPFSEETVTVSEKQGSLAKKIIFNVKENGKYRIVTNDIVENMSMSDEIVVSTIASEGLSVWTEGNPTEWTNQSATIKVYATNTDCDIKSITVDGNTTKMNNIGIRYKTYYTSFVVDENSSHTITVTDEAGYSKTTTVDVTKIDKVKPVISTNAKSISYNKKGLGKVTVTISDNASGIKSVEINGASFKITNPEKQIIKVIVEKGTKVNVKATDAATNVETGGDDTPAGDDSVVEDGDAGDNNGNDSDGGDDGDNENDDSTKSKKKTIKKKAKILPIVTEEEEKTEPEKRKKKVEVTKIKEDEPQPEQPVKKGLPTGAKIAIATTTGGALLIFLFFMFTNVTIYAADTEGKYKLVGKTTAKRRKDFYEVKTPKFSVNRALTGNFKYVFSKSFCKVHKDWEINIIIDSKEFTRYLREDEDSIYIQYTKTLK